MACRVVVYPGLGVRMPCGVSTRVVACEVASN